MESDSATREVEDSEVETSDSTGAEITPLPVSPGDDERRDRIVLAINVALAAFVVAFTLFFMIRSERGAGFLLEIPKSITAPWDPDGGYSSATRDRHKILIAMLAIGLAVAGRVLSKSSKHQKPITAALAALVLVAFHVESQKDLSNLLRGREFQYWNTYHYYLGSKYFDELKYIWLYTYTLRADEEIGENRTADAQRVMDLIELEEVPRERVLAQSEGRSDFTPERWEEFKRDIRFFNKWISPYNWSRVLRDHGYNATPTWNTFGSAISNTFPLQNRWSRAVVLSLDLVMLIATFIAVGWAFGARPALLMSIFFLIFFGNEFFTVGGFIRYDWYCATVIAFVLYHKGYWRASAPFLAFAAMTRIFPGFLLLGPGIQWLVAGIRTRRFEKKAFQMFAVFAFSCVLMFLAGALNSDGFTAWKDFLVDIRQHTAKHYLGPKRIGLKHLFIDDFSTRRWAKDDKQRAFDRQETAYRVTWVVMMGLFFAAILKRRPRDAWLLGYMFIFTLVVLSRYYWALFSMMFLLAETERSRWRNAWSDVLILLMMPVGLAYRMHEKTNIANHMIMTTWIGAYFVALAISFLVDDIIDWLDARRAKALAAATNDVPADLPVVDSPTA